MFSDVNLNVDNDDSLLGVNEIRLENDFVEELKKYSKTSKLNMLNKDGYRDRINKLYNDVGGIKPIDNKINNVIYFDDYEEIGLVLNKKNISLKQAWTEYRLLYNEKQREDDKIMDNSYVLDNFDEIFERIANKVDGVENYIRELNSMKEDVRDKSLTLDYSREAFGLEKLAFENYCKVQNEKFDKKEKELNEKLARVNSLLIQLDDKMKMLMNNNE